MTRQLPRAGQLQNTHLWLLEAGRGVPDPRYVGIFYKPRGIQFLLTSRITAACQNFAWTDLEVRPQQTSHDPTHIGEGIREHWPAMVYLGHWVCFGFNKFFGSLCYLLASKNTDICHSENDSGTHASSQKGIHAANFFPNQFLILCTPRHGKAFVHICACLSQSVCTRTLLHGEVPSAQRGKTTFKTYSTQAGSRSLLLGLNPWKMPLQLS